MNSRTSVCWKLLAASGLVIAAALFLLYPWRVVSVTYRKCNSNDPKATFSVKRSTNNLTIYNHGELYLKTETVYAALVLVVGVERIEWNRVLVERILKEQKELGGKLNLEGDHWYLRTKLNERILLDWPNK